VDKVVLARGRVDHKDQGETKLIVQEAEAFEPSPEELRSARPAAPEPTRLTLRVEAAAFGPGLLDELKTVFSHFPGESEVLLEMETREGLRCLRFGSSYRVQPSNGLRAELDALLGPGVLAA
jgi:DNA polymerase-3 subunit alpha